MATVCVVRLRKYSFNTATATTGHGVRLDDTTRSVHCLNSDAAAPTAAPSASRGPTDADAASRRVFRIELNLLNPATAWSVLRDAVPDGVRAVYLRTSAAGATLTIAHAAVASVRFAGIFSQRLGTPSVGQVQSNESTILEANVQSMDAT